MRSIDGREREEEVEDEEEEEGEDEAEDARDAEAEDAAATKEDELLFCRFLPLLLLFVSPPPLEKAVEEDATAAGAEEEEEDEEEDEEEEEEEEAGLPAIVSSSYVGFQPGARRRDLASRLRGDDAKLTSAFAVSIVLSLLVSP